MQQRRAFVLLIVIGILATLSFLAVVIAKESTAAAKLSKISVNQTHAWLGARSAAHVGLAHLKNTIINGDLRVPMASTSPPIEGSLHEGQVRWKSNVNDLSGALDLNDGIEAGRLELGPSYQANAVDPWPNNGASGEDVSATINLRLRRLLNAYGEAIRFSAMYGWPTWKKTDWDNGQFGNWGQPYNFISADARPRYISIQEGEGLGDKILVSRPPVGWARISSVQSIVDIWGQTHLPQQFIDDINGSLFKHIRNDLAINAKIDSDLYRLKREHAADIDSNGFPDVPTDSTTSQIPSMLYLDSDGPDFGPSAWAPHAASLINLNAASNYVRAAIFYAPANVQLMAEGAGEDFIEYGTYEKNLDDGIDTVVNLRPSLGVAGPVFESSRITENGVHISSGTNYVQDMRLMSLRDAMVLSRAYEDYSLTAGWPDTFDKFEQALRKIVDLTPPNERATYLSGAPTQMNFRRPAGSAWFSQHYLEFLLPHCLSGVRRLNGLFGAPLALLTPYIQEGGSIQLGPGLHNSNYALRSAEDFVVRSHLPKIDFLPSGLYHIHATGTSTIGHLSAERSIHVNVNAFDSTVARSQKTFQNMSEPTWSHSDIKIGPEPIHTDPNQRVDPSEIFGTIGLKSQALEPSSTGTKSVDLLFKDSLDAEPGSNLDVENSNTDPLNITGQPGVEEWIPSGSYPIAAFSQNAVDLLRNTIPSSTKTWRVPTDPVLFIINQNLFATLLAMRPWTDASGNPLILNPNDPSPGNVKRLLDAMVRDGFGGSWDEVTWIVCQIYSIDVNTAWLTNWSNGLPSATVPDMSKLKASGLEGADVSIFGPGSTGSDLSPFGGALFGSRGHGARAPDVYNDSLYWRPHTFLAGGQPAGSEFATGWFSFDVRIPTGYQHAQQRRTLLHMTFWESVELRQNNGAAPITVTRPVNLSAHLLGTTNLGDLFGSKIWNRIRWRHGQLWAPNNGINIPVPTTSPGTIIPFPSSDTAFFDQSHIDFNPLWSQFMGVPRRVSWQPTLNDSKYFNYEAGPVNRPAMGSRSIEFTGSGFISEHSTLPGTTVRLVGNWDFSKPVTHISGSNHQAWRHAITTLKYWNAGSAMSHLSNAPSFCPDMIISLGETAMVVTPYSDESNLYATGHPKLTAGKFAPIHRLDSSIDNFMIRLGDPGGPTREKEFSSHLNSNSNYSRCRFNLSAEPEAFFKINLPPGSRILSIGTRTYDMPYRPQDWGHSAKHETTYMRYGECGLDLYDGQSNLVADVPATASTVIEQGQTITRRTTSVEKKYYNAVPTTNNFAIRLKWLNSTLDGSSVPKFVGDIAWVSEMNWRWIPPNGFRIFGWEAN